MAARRFISRDHDTCQDLRLRLQALFLEGLVPKTLAIGLASLALALTSGGCARSPAPDAVVLYSLETPAMRAALPSARCAAFPIEGFRDAGVRSRTVVIAGHASPPTYLGRPAAEVAAAIASFHPDLVVLDTCYGASTPLLDALVAAGTHAWVVGPPFRIADTGFVYAPGFLDAASPARRAGLVATQPPFPLLRWELDGARLQAVHAAVDRLDAKGLRTRLRSAFPPLVRMPVPGGLERDGSVLVLVPPERFR